MKSTYLEWTYQKRGYFVSYSERGFIDLVFELDRILSHLVTHI